jgi:cysteinyl-tRNA synthetase
MRLREPNTNSTADKELAGMIERCRSAFREAMEEDFNTPVAIAELQRLRTDVNKLLVQGLSTEARLRAREEFRSLGNVLGLFSLDKWHYTLKAESGSYQLSDVDIDRKVAERNEARKQKDFKKADEIRQSLAAHGIVIEDKPDGTSRWKR